jgi:hypothetical protein
MLNPYLKLGGRRAQYTGMAVLATVTMFAVMWHHGAPLKEPTAEKVQTLRGIVELELCWNAAKANGILESWTTRTSFRNPDVRLLDVAIEDTWLDFGFIVIDATAATLLCGYAATRPTYHLLRSTLIVLAWAQLGAGCLDVIENICMLIMLYSGKVTGDFLPIVTCQWAPKTRQRWARQNQPLEAKA